MANRTLRRPYTEANRSGDGMPQVGGVESIADDSNAGRDADVNRGTNVDSEDTIGESDNVSSVSYTVVDPTKIGEFIAAGGSEGNASDNGNGDTRKRRSDAGQKRGTRGRRKAAEIPTLVTIHTVLNSWGSFVFNELKLDADEKKQMDEALANFADYHELPLLSPKTASTIELLNALALVYGPRVYCISNRMKMEARIKKAKNVHPFSKQMNQAEAVQ